MEDLIKETVIPASAASDGRPYDWVAVDRNIRSVLFAKSEVLNSPNYCLLGSDAIIHRCM
jgi:hypothetical protein